MEKQIQIPDTNLGAYDIPFDCNKRYCVDIGANIGDFTTSQAANFDVLHYYEPYEPCYNRIKSRTEGLPNVTGYKEAVYKVDGMKLPLIAHANYHAGSTALKTDAINQDWVDDLDLVQTVSLPTILSRIGGHINYLKVDCETSEYYLLINQDLLEVDFIGIELHWQMGKQKYDNLVEHILHTHICTGDNSWTEGSNKEVLFKNKLL